MLRFFGMGNAEKMSFWVEGGFRVERRTLGFRRLVKKWGRQMKEVNKCSPGAGTKAWAEPFCCQARGVGGWGFMATDVEWARAAGVSPAESDSVWSQACSFFTIPEP